MGASSLLSGVVGRAATPAPSPVREHRAERAAAEDVEVVVRHLLHACSPAFEIVR